MDNPTEKRKKPIYYILSNFQGKFTEDYLSGTQEDWDGGFISYTGEYVLLIRIDSFNTLAEEGLFGRINKKILNDLQCDRVKVCLLLQEGGSHDSVLNKVIYEFLQKEFLKFNIKESNIVYTDNNFILETEFKKHYPESKIKVVSHNWQLWRYVDCQTGVLTEEDLLKTKDTIRDKHFLSYNRSPHPHRCVAGLEMFRNKLYKKGIVSFPSDFDGIEDNQFSLQEGIDMFYNEEDYDKKLINKFRKDLPWMADVDTIFSSENIWDSVIIQTSFLKTYFSFVVGSVFDSYHDNEPYSVFMSEKIYKPITNFHPFLYLSNMGTLEILKELGFKTFHPFIDESYDREPDKLKRLNMVIDELNRLCEMELSELHELYWSMSDILIYNQRIYYNEVFSIAENRIEDVLKIVME